MMINKDINTNPTDEMQRCLEYVEALEAERNKIQVFQRELPLCLELVTRAIEGCRQQLCGGGATANYMNGQSECSEQTSSDFVPVLEEFIPMKRACSSNNEEDDEEEEGDEDIHIGSGNSRAANKIISSKKPDWLRSVQLCIQTPDPPPVKQDSPRKVAVAEVKRNGGGAFHPFKKEKEKEKEKSCGVVTPVVVPAAAASSTAETGGSGGGASKNSTEDKEGQGQSNRKARRCWSPELHRRFLQALSQLGGAHVATPKQIRELMKVDGLTNDEVKSHLQKYRLHTRRPSPSVHNANSAPATQFVVVGGIWMPPPEYATMGSAPPSGGGDVNGGGTVGVYAPRASVPPSVVAEASTSLTKRQQHQSKKTFHSDDKGCQSEGGMHSNSQSTSSSTHTTTASPIF